MVAPLFRVVTLVLEHQVAFFTIRNRISVIVQNLGILAEERARA